MKTITSNPTLWTEMTDDLSETVNGGSHEYYNYHHKNHHKDHHKDHYDCDDYKRYYR